MYLPLHTLNEQNANKTLFFTLIVSLAKFIATCVPSVDRYEISSMENHYLGQKLIIPNVPCHMPHKALHTPHGGYVGSSISNSLDMAAMNIVLLNVRVVTSVARRWNSNDCRIERKTALTCNWPSNDLLQLIILNCRVSGTNLQKKNKV